MTKSERIRLLEIQVETLQKQVKELQASGRWWNTNPYVPTWTTPNTIWPHEITSHMVNLNDNPDAAKALYQNRWELYE